MKFFVSYSRSVQDSVREIILSLRDDGETVWWDQDLRAGQDWWATILNTIEASDVCLFMMSEKAVQSPYCMEELRYALTRNRLVLPYVMDAPISYTIPPEIMRGRVQYETYSGDPNHIKNRIRITCKGVDWSQYKDRFASRPPEPNTGSDDLVARLDKAIALAQEGVFDTAIEGFIDVAHNDHANYGEFCHTWIDRINRYKEIASLSTHASMRKLTRPKWEAFLKQYSGEDEDTFDPLGVQEKLNPGSAPQMPASSSVEVQRVYVLIEEVRKAQAEGLDFEADPYLYELGELGEVAVLPVLTLLQDPIASMRVSAVNILGRIGDERAIEPIIGMLRDSDSDVRWAASHMLAMLEDVRAIEPLIGILTDPHAEVREMVVTALSMFNDPRIVESLIATLTDDDEKVRVKVVQALGELGDQQAVDPLITYFGNVTSTDLAEEVIKTLGRLGGVRVVETLQLWLNEDRGLEKSICDVLVKLQAVDALIETLESQKDFFDKKDSTRLVFSYATIRCAVVMALGDLRDKRALDAVTQALNDRVDSVRKAAQDALRKIRAANPDV